MRSRPWRLLRTSPDFCITRKCFVTACRVISSPSLNLVIEAGPPAQSREINRKRISSPNAANKDAEWKGASGLGLGCLCKVFLDQLNNDGPALVVRFQGLGSPLQRDLIEAGFGYCQQDPAADFFQGKDN